MSSMRSMEAILQTSIGDATRIDTSLQVGVPRKNSSAFSPRPKRSSARMVGRHESGGTNRSVAAVALADVGQYMASILSRRYKSTSTRAHCHLKITAMSPLPSLFLIVAMFCSLAAHAAVVRIGAVRDTTIYQNNVNNSAGGSPGLLAGTNGSGSPRRALLGFDLGTIPGGAIISDVELTLTLGQVGGATSATIGLFKLTEDWGEGTAGSTALTISGTGAGFAANSGDATWNSAFHSAITPTLWSTPGGAHTSTASGSLFLGTNTLGTAFTWPSTPQLIADVQSWLEEPSGNFGWALINANESVPNAAFGFYSSEWRTFPGGMANQEPALRITYTVPEPGVSVFIMLAGVLGMARHRRSRLAE